MDQYDDFEIGELDPDDPEVAGTQSLDRYNEVFDKFLEKHTENTCAPQGRPRRLPSRRVG